MRKIIVGAMVSMDGVMQAPGGANEDPTKAFKFGSNPPGKAEAARQERMKREG